MQRPAPNPWISGITAYVPGSAGNKDRHPVKLSSNENPWGPAPSAMAVLREPHAVHRYPDPGATSLRRKLGALHDLDPDRIVCGTGSDEILQLLAMIYCRPGDSVVHVAHGFQVYPIAAKRVGAVPLAAPDRDYVADVDAILATIRDDTRLIYIANPNNPTGTMIPRTEIERLHKGLRPDILLVVDQAYAEYCDEADPDGGLHLARTTENVVATRTFSKIYGLGGLRVGWGTGPAAIIREINRVRAPFPISVPSLAAAEAALDDQDYVRLCRERNLAGRKALEALIADVGDLGFAAVPSAANFILMQCPENGPFTAEALYQDLGERGYIVRWLPQQDLPHALRISIGTEDEMAGFETAFREIIGHK